MTSQGKRRIEKALMPILTKALKGLRFGGDNATSAR
jgi:hypothetical protein